MKSPKFVAAIDRTDRQNCIVHAELLNKIDRFTGKLRHRQHVTHRRSRRFDFVSANKIRRFHELVTTFKIVVITQRLSNVSRRRLPVDNQGIPIFYQLRGDPRQAAFGIKIFSEAAMKRRFVSRDWRVIPPCTLNARPRLTKGSTCRLTVSPETPN